MVSVDWKVYFVFRVCVNVWIGCVRKGKFIRVGISYEVCDEVFR